MYIQRIDYSLESFEEEEFHLGSKFEHKEDFSPENAENNHISWKSKKRPELIILTEDLKIVRKFYRIENLPVKIGNLILEKDFIGTAEKKYGFLPYEEGFSKYRIRFIYSDALLIAVQIDC